MPKLTVKNDKKASRYIVKHDGKKIHNETKRAHVAKVLAKKTLRGVRR